MPDAYQDGVFFSQIHTDSGHAGRQGIAHRILDFACRYGRSHGCITFRIDTYAGNMPAAHLYEQYGFRLVSIAPLLLHGSIQENQRFYEYKL